MKTLKGGEREGGREKKREKREREEREKREREKLTLLSSGGEEKGMTEWGLGG